VAASVRHLVVFLRKQSIDKVWELDKEIG
jgi:hypothetical protein